MFHANIKINLDPIIRYVAQTGNVARLKTSWWIIFILDFSYVYSLQQITKQFQCVTNSNTPIYPRLLLLVLNKNFTLL